MVTLNGHIPAYAWCLCIEIHCPSGKKYSGIIMFLPWPRPKGGRTNVSKLRLMSRPSHETSMHWLFIIFIMRLSK